MPQVLKEAVRQRILDAAIETFAGHGYEGASMASIAERAGLGTATSYRYFASKAELLDAVLPAELVQRFERLLDRRVRSLARIALADPAPSAGRARAPEAGVDPTGEEMLRFWIDHRLAVVVLLDRAAGTPYAGYAERFVSQLVTTTLAAIRAHHPGLRVSAAARFVLERIFEGTRRTLAAILLQHPDEGPLRDAIEGFWSYQIPGLRGFAAWVQQPPR